MTYEKLKQKYLNCKICYAFIPTSSTVCPVCNEIDWNPNQPLKKSNDYIEFSCSQCKEDVCITFKMFKENHIYSCPYCKYSHHLIYIADCPCCSKKSVFRAWKIDYDFAVDAVKSTIGGFLQKNRAFEQGLEVVSSFFDSIPEGIRGVCLHCSEMSIRCPNCQQLKPEREFDGYKSERCGKCRISFRAP